MMLMDCCIVCGEMENIIWSYDIQKDALKVEHDLHMENKAKYAGGVTDKRGNIICAPANRK